MGRAFGCGIAFRTTTEVQSAEGLGIDFGLLRMDGRLNSRFLDETENSKRGLSED
jgi:hypothetical protein